MDMFREASAFWRMQQSGRHGVRARNNLQAAIVVAVRQPNQQRTFSASVNYGNPVLPPYFFYSMHMAHCVLNTMKP